MLIDHSLNNHQQGNIRIKLWSKSSEVYRHLQNIPLTGVEHTLFSSVPTAFSKIDSILDHKASLNKYKILK